MTGHEDKSWGEQTRDWLRDIIPARSRRLRESWEPAAEPSTDVEDVVAPDRLVPVLAVVNVALVAVFVVVLAGMGGN